VLWAPAQALFESDGRTFVYAQIPDGFRPRDVKSIRRSVAIEGLPEDRAIALASPEQSKAENKKGRGAMQAIPK
jgi:HlyD family secretion protein